MKEKTIVIPFRRNEAGRLQVGITLLKKRGKTPGSYDLCGFPEVNTPERFLPAPKIPGYPKRGYLTSEYVGEMIVHVVVAMTGHEQNPPKWFMPWEDFACRTRRHCKYGNFFVDEALLEPTSKIISALLLVAGFDPERDLRT